MRDGAVDPRLMLVLAAMSTAHRIAVADFPADPLDAPGLPRRRAVLTVVDHGAWLPPSAFRGNRRHGLPLMEACVETLTVDGTDHGTTVVLRSRAVPPSS